MINKILNAILSVAIAVLVASLVIITGVQYRYFGNMQISQLKDELHFAAVATEKLGKDYLESLDSERYRLTWVDVDGTVLFDSHADELHMDNHANREEIIEAMNSGKGSSMRQSSTLTEETIYESVRLDDGSVLRISISRATALVLVLGMVRPMAIVMVFALALSVWLAVRMAKRVVEPLNQINLEKPLENDVYEELSPLLYRIHAQHLEIENQMQILLNKENQFDQITSNMSEALVLLDDEGKIISINPAAKALFGTGDECVGEAFLTIERKQSMRYALEEVYEKGQAAFRGKKNGKEYQFDLSCIQTNGINQGMVILAYDITEQVNAERHRQEFTANVSHELKTPLQTIIGSAELIENGIVRTEDMPRFVGHIRKEATRLVDLINDIIRLSQIDEETEMPSEDISLKEISEEVCEIFSETAKQKSVALEVVGDEGNMQGVRRLLYEVVYNLCDNAIKYNREGGRVRISIEQEEKQVILSVQDTGIGISSEHQDKVFERFYRVDKSHSKQSGGTGLGLSIVKHAVMYHHGKIMVESELNKGTEIMVVFERNI